MKVPFDDIKKYMEDPSSRVDFNHPPRDYVEKKALQWPLLVEKELTEKDPELAVRAENKLIAQLQRMLDLFPQAAHPVFKNLKLFLMGGKSMKGGGYDSGGEYHQKVSPDFYKYLDPRMASSVVLYSAENYDWLSDFWSLKVILHEFSHAYQLEQWPEDKPEIVKAWEHAKEQGLYKKAARHDSVILEEPYVMTNALEYFAELSCMYFCGCDYAPYNRNELRLYDPTGYAMIEQLWGLDSADS